MGSIFHIILKSILEFFKSEFLDFEFLNTIKFSFITL